MNLLETLKVGDWVWTIQSGWVKIFNIEANVIYPIKVNDKYRTNYTIDGKNLIQDKYPSLFLEPPAGFNAEPKPCEFKRGDRVLVQSSNEEKWNRRYFAEYVSGNKRPYRCFDCGADEWSSEGNTSSWRYCKKWEEE